MKGAVVPLFFLSSCFAPSSGFVGFSRISNAARLIKMPLHTEARRNSPSFSSSSCSRWYPVHAAGQCRRHAELEQKGCLGLSASGQVPFGKNRRQFKLKRYSDSVSIEEEMNKALGDRTTLDTVSHLNGSVSCFAVLRLDATASTGSCEPSNVVLASGAHDGKLRLWRLNATEEVEVYDQQNDPPPQLLPFGTVTMSADDRSIFSLQCIGRELWVGRGKSRQAECWEYDDGELKAKLKDARKAGPTELSGDGMRKKYDMPDHTGWVRSISSCGDLVFTCGCNFIKVWRHKGEEVEHVGDLESDADILSLCCSPDLLFSGDIRGRIWVWDIRPLLQGGQDVQAVKPCIVQAHDGRITGMKWSPREEEGESGQDMLFSCSHDGFLKCWKPSEEGSLVGGGSSSAMTLKLVAEANALKGMGILARDWERLLSMEISPPGTGKVIQGNMNTLSGHYLYLGTSGGTILVYDRTLKDGELQMVQVSPKMIDLVGGGKISAMLAIPWANRPGKILFLGTDTGKILPWRPVH